MELCDITVDEDVVRADCCSGMGAVVVVFVLPGTDGGGTVPIGGICGAVAALTVDGSAVPLGGTLLEVTVEPMLGFGRARDGPPLPSCPPALGVGVTGPTVLLVAALGIAPTGRAPTTNVAPRVRGGGGFFLLLFGSGGSVSISSFGIVATLAKNIFSSVCAITTTSSPGLLYT